MLFMSQNNCYTFHKINVIYATKLLLYMTQNPCSMLYISHINGIYDTKSMLSYVIKACVIIRHKTRIIIRHKTQCYCQPLPMCVFICINHLFIITSLFFL